MNYSNFKISTDFKNASSKKDFKAKAFLYKSDNIYKLVIDRDDDRRQVIAMNEDEFESFKNLINQF